MTTVIQRKRTANEYRVPAGGEILWYGVASALPQAFAIDAYCSNVFVRGVAAGGASNTQAGLASHSHSNPATTGAVADHTHPIDGTNTGTGSGSNETFLSGNVNSASVSHTHSIPAGTSAAGGAHSHGLAATDVAVAYPPYARLYWVKALQDAGVPVGGIIMLDAVIANRPTGFQLCDGAGGTPDLRSKFIYGAAADGDVGGTGGSSTHTHNNVDTAAGGAHAHTVNLGASGGSSTSNENLSGFQGEEVTRGGHTHNLSATLNTDADHTHTLGATGSASNLPAYLRLYFVMRTQ